MVAAKGVGVPSEKAKNLGRWCLKPRLYWNWLCQHLYLSNLVSTFSSCLFLVKCLCRGAFVPAAWDPPGAGGTGRCEPPNMGAGNEAQVLCKSSVGLCLAAEQSA